nr:MAG TPA: hypothetical protein [Caudoviricetes sp.]
MTAQPFDKSLCSIKCTPWIVNLPKFPHSFMHLHYALVRISYTKKWLDIRAKSPCFFVRIEFNS